MRGKLIVIEGTDGSGKGTQFGMALERMKREGMDFRSTDFPRYGHPAAYFVEKYLRGEYGKLRPGASSLFYALDRFDAKAEMEAWLAAGLPILSNRYTTSSLGHQAGKAKDAKERRHLVNLISKLEYETLGLPRPDLVILLKMHPFVAQQLIMQKAQRTYLNGAKMDIYEEDIGHLTKAAESYLFVAKRDKSWIVIDCMKRITKKKLLDPAVSPLEKVKSVEEIHELVWKEITRILK
jgi:dTMP kinase